MPDLNTVENNEVDDEVYGDGDGPDYVSDNSVGNNYGDGYNFNNEQGFGGNGFGYIRGNGYSVKSAWEGVLCQS